MFDTRTTNYTNGEIIMVYNEVTRQIMVSMLCVSGKNDVESGPCALRMCAQSVWINITLSNIIKDWSEGHHLSSIL